MVIACRQLFTSGSRPVVRQRCQEATNPGSSWARSPLGRTGSTKSGGASTTLTDSAPPEPRGTPNPWHTSSPNPASTRKDNSCVEVCPVDCIHPTPDEPDYDTVKMLYIDPEECIDCDACVEGLPVDACFARGPAPRGVDRLRADQRAVLRGQVAPREPSEARAPCRSKRVEEHLRRVAAHPGRYAHADTPSEPSQKLGDHHVHGLPDRPVRPARPVRRRRARDPATPAASSPRTSSGPSSSASTCWAPRTSSSCSTRGGGLLAATDEQIDAELERDTGQRPPWRPARSPIWRTRCGSPSASSHASPFRRHPRGHPRADLRRRDRRTAPSSRAPARRTTSPRPEGRAGAQPGKRSR